MFEHRITRSRSSVRRLRLERLEDRLSPATLTVNSTADTANSTDPYLSLREAIAIVNSPTLPDGLSAQILAQIDGTLHDGGADTIAFDPTAVTGPIMVGNPALILNLPASTASVTIDGGSGVTLQGVGGFRVLTVAAGVEATFENLTISRTGLGNQGTLTLTHCTLSSNSNAAGGAISNAGTMTVSDCTLTGNNGGNPSNGGAIYNGGTMTVSNSTFSNNNANGLGGAIYTGGSLTVIGSTFSSNHAAAGGAIAGGGTLAVTGCTISFNTAAGQLGYDGGGIYWSSGTATVSNSTLSANTGYGYGGGICNKNAASQGNATMTVIGCTLSGNSATTNGGGIYTQQYASGHSLLTVSNSTLSGNQAPGGGGGLYQNGLMVVRNTIVAGNTSTDHGPDISGAVSGASGYDLVGNSDGLSGLSNGVAGNLIGRPLMPIDARLGPLADNGGPTLTQALLDDSPARGAGDPTGAPATDQRGFPRLVSGEIDLGSFQTQTAVAGPRLVLSDPDGIVGPQVNHVRLTFNHPVDPTSATTAAFSLTGPAGDIPVTGVAVVGSSNGQQIDVLFPSQTDPGQYTLTVGTELLDIYGNPPDGSQTAGFGVLGDGFGSTLTVNSTADTANPTDPYLSLREAITLVNGPYLPLNLSPQILAQISGPLHTDGNDTIVFDPAGVTGPIVLRGRQLELSLPGSTASVTIDGGNGVTLDGNRASRVLQVDAGAQVALNHLTITHGRATGATAPENGGGILNAGTLTVACSTLSANSASASGGGIFNSGSLTVTSSTLSANSAQFSGGGIFNSLGTGTVSNSTLSANSAGSFGGGIYTQGGTSLRLQNALVAGNRTSDIFGAVNSTSSYNLVGNGSGLSGISDGVDHNQIGTSASPIDPLLGPLGDYGGPTQTSALLPGSPALGAGDPALLDTPDQRGVIRSGGVNIGSFQASAAFFVVSAPDSVTAGAAFDVTVSAFDWYSQPAVGYSGTISFSSADPFGAILPMDYTFSLADGGSHTFLGQTSLYTAGFQDVTASDVLNGLSGSANVLVNPGAAFAFQVMAPSSAVSGTPFDVTIVALDAYGNTATGYTGTIHFSTTDQDPGVVLPADYTFTASDAGMVTFPAGVTLITPGQQTLTVTDLASGISGSTVVTL